MDQASRSTVPEFTRRRTRNQIGSNPVPQRSSRLTPKIGSEEKAGDWLRLEYPVSVAIALE
jgi:hypothetical protein